MMYYDRQGNPVDDDLEMWQADRRRVGLDALVLDGVKVSVSTVHLVIDHQWAEGGPPLIFETMVFGVEDNDQLQWRYSTEEQARAGHDRVVKFLRAGRLADLRRLTC